MKRLTQLNTAQRALFATLLALASLGAAAQSSATRIVDFQYDSLGRLTKEIIQPGGGADECLVTTHSYDERGNRNSSTIKGCDGGEGGYAAPGNVRYIAPRTTTVTYDGSTRRFPVHQVNAEGHVEERQYDTRFGTVTRVTETSNGPENYTDAQYDEFGRRFLVIKLDRTRELTEVIDCRPNCPAGVTQVRLTPQTETGGQNGPIKSLYLDAHGREVRTETQGMGKTNDYRPIFTVTTYDNLGRVATRTRPYFSGTSPTVYGNLVYDSLDRIKSEVTEDGKTQSYTYDGVLTSVTNGANQTTTKRRNSQGQIIQITDALGSHLTHEFDAFGNLIKTRDPKGHQITLQYNLRGFKLAMSDPDMGSWSYQHNALGELVSQTDPKAQTATLQYDRLGRLKQRNEADLISHWFYDKYEDNSACLGGIGRLCEAKSDNGWRNKQHYDSRGRISAAHTTTGTHSFSVYSTWDDPTGRLKYQAYPSSLAVSYHYHTTLGYLQELRRFGGNAYWKESDYDAEYRLIDQQYGNGIQTQQVFNATTGKITAITAGAGNSVQNLSYTHQLATGNLMSRSDANQNLIESLTYDPLNRITSSLVNASAVSPAGYTVFAYDALGNMICKSDLATWCNGASPNMIYGAIAPDGRVMPHAVKQISGTVHGHTNPTYQYDLNGNFISGAGRTATWTSFNMPKVMDRPGVYNAEFFYGADHQRVKQVATGGGVTRTIYYLHPDQANGLLYEHDTQGTTTTQRHYLTAGGQVVAEVKLETVNGVWQPEKTQYFHRDDLGSITTITNEAGQVIERMAYDAWGKRRYPNGTTDPADSIHADPATIYNTDRGYTNHEMLDELGLIHMNGRIYDPAMARFLSPDPTIPNPEWLQDFNRFSYVLNNPFAMTDPTGFTEEGDEDSGAGKGGETNTEGTPTKSEPKEDPTKACSSCEKSPQNPGSRGSAGGPPTEERSIWEAFRDVLDLLGAFLGGQPQTAPAMAVAKGLGKKGLEKAAKEAAEKATAEKLAREAAEKKAKDEALKIDPNKVKPTPPKEKPKPEPKPFSDEKKALVEMAKSDKKTGITPADMEAYKELNKTLPDPFPTNKVRGPEAHPKGAPSSQAPHGHVGPVDHIPVRDDPL